MKNKIIILLFILIIFIGILLRIYNLGKYNFWRDEVFSVLVAKGIAPWDMASYSYLIDSPLFCLFLRLWLKLGDSEFILRLFPFIFGVLSIPAIYLVAKELFDKKVGLISAFILTISPFHIYYSQELRTYSLVTFLVLIAIYCLIKSLKENRIFSWVGFVIFTTLTIYSHNMALLLLIAINFYIFYFYKKYKVIFRRWLTSQFFILLFYLPWVEVILKQIAHIKAANFYNWLPKDYLFNIIQTFLIFNLGYNANTIINLLAILLILPLFIFVIYDKIYKEEIYMLLWWLFIPLIIVIMFSIMIFPAYIIRTTIYLSAVYYIIVSYGLSKLKPNKIYLYFLLFFIILTAISLKNYYQNIFPSPEFPYSVGFHPRMEFKLASNYINQNYQNGNIVVDTGGFFGVTYLPFLYYCASRLEGKIFVVTSQDYASLINSKVDEKIKVKYTDLNEIQKKNYKRLWLISSSFGNDQKNPFSKNIIEYLNRNYTMMDTKDFVGIKIRFYQKR